MKSSSAATPVTISGVTSGIRVTAPTARAGRDVIRSRPRASMVPRTSEPSAATVAIRRLALSDSSSALLLKKSEYHRVLKPEKPTATSRS